MKPDKELAAAFAERLHQYEVHLGWIQKDFVHFTGLDRQTRNGWETGGRPVTREQVNCVAVAIAQAQDRKSFSEILDGDETKSEEANKKQKEEVEEDLQKLETRTINEPGYRELRKDADIDTIVLDKTDKRLLRKQCEHYLRLSYAARGRFLENLKVPNTEIVVGGLAVLERILGDLLLHAGFALRTPRTPSLARRIARTRPPERTLRIGWFDWPGFTTHAGEKMRLEPQRLIHDSQSISALLTEKVVSLLDIHPDRIKHVPLSFLDLRSPGLFSRVDMLEPLISTPARKLLFRTSKRFENVGIGLSILMRRKTLLYVREELRKRHGIVPEQTHQEYFSNDKSSAAYAQLALDLRDSDGKRVIKPLYAQDSTPDMIRALVLNKFGLDEVDTPEMEADIRRALALLCNSGSSSVSPHYFFLTDSLTAGAVKKHLPEWNDLALLSEEHLGHFSMDLVMGLPDDEIFANAVSEAVEIVGRSQILPETFITAGIDRSFWSGAGNTRNGMAIIETGDTRVRASANIEGRMAPGGKLGRADNSVRDSSNFIKVELENQP